MRKIFLLSLPTLLLAATGCHTTADPQPQPTAKQTAIVNEGFTAYATSTLPVTSQTKALVADKPTGQLRTDKLTLVLPVLDGGNRLNSQVEFVLPAGQQRAHLVGTYQLASQPNAAQGEALLTYARPSNDNTLRGNYFSSNANAVAGTLTITYYDAGNHIISGNYQAQLPGVKDPFVYVATGYPRDERRVGDLQLSGTFVEVLLTE